MAVTDTTRDLGALVPYVREKAERWIAACKAAGLDVGVSETYRSPERQAWLYTQGRTTVKPLGAHSFRVALDFYFNEKGNIYPVDKMRRAAAIAKTIGFEWGGDWKSFVDMPHLQMLGGVPLAQYRQGKRPSWYNATPTAWPDKEDEMNQADFDRMMEDWLKRRDTLPVSDWALEGWDKATTAKIFDGSAPRGFLTREQAAIVLERRMGANSG